MANENKLFETSKFCKNVINKCCHRRDDYERPKGYNKSETHLFSVESAKKIIEISLITIIRLDDYEGQRRCDKGKTHLLLVESPKKIIKIRLITIIRLDDYERQNGMIKAKRIYFWLKVLRKELKLA